MKYLIASLLIVVSIDAYAQSIEIMPHEDGVFGDIQFLKPLSKDYKWTVFSRTRLNSDLSQDHNILSALYISYTTSSGFGGTMLGAISNNSSVSGTGIHFTKFSDAFTIFMIPYVTFQEDVSLNWFSIMRYTPSINERWRLYTSIELFSVYNDRHIVSIQRLRSGLQVGSYQFGIGVNMREAGETLSYSGDYGVFLRKTFN